MLNIILSYVLFGLVAIAASIIAVVCACVVGKMDKGTCNRVRFAYVIIFMAAVGSAASLYIKPPSLIEALSLTGLAVLFLFDRRNYYGSDNRDCMQNMPMAEKDVQV